MPDPKQAGASYAGQQLNGQWGAAIPGRTNIEKAKGAQGGSAGEAGT